MLFLQSKKYKALKRREEILYKILNQILRERSAPSWWNDPFPKPYFPRIERVITLINKTQNKITKVYNEHEDRKHII